MSSGHLIIRSVEGERRIEGRNLPLRVGTSSECELRLPGPGGEPVALLDLLDGTPFVQPVGRSASLAINGDPLEASRRLQDGDELQFYGSRIRLLVDDGNFVLDVRLEDSAYVTRPPEVTDEEDIPDDETIAPTAFTRAAETAARLEESKTSPLKIIIGGGLAFLLLASYLLFSAKSVEFEITPTGADSFSIDGGWFRLPMGNRTLLRKGNYTVNVQKQGYYDIEQNFVVGDDQSMTVSLRMRKKPGRLLVQVEPAVDAIVTVDQGQVGKAPFGPVELEPGLHTVSVETERFLPFTGAIDMQGLDLLEDFNVQLVPRWANVRVESEPAGAIIFAGDQEIGVTPATIELLEGSHEIAISKDGFSPWDGTVIAQPNVDQQLPVIFLQPADARLIVNSIPRGANVTVNGRYRGPIADHIVAYSGCGLRHRPVKSRLRRDEAQYAFGVERQ